MKNTLQIKLGELRKANDNKALRITELEKQARDVLGLERQIEHLKRQIVLLQQWKTHVLSTLQHLES